MIYFIFLDAVMIILELESGGRILEKISTKVTLLEALNRFQNQIRRCF